MLVPPLKCLGCVLAFCVPYLMHVCCAPAVAPQVLQMRLHLDQLGSENEALKQQLRNQKLLMEQMQVGACGTLA